MVKIVVMMVKVSVTGRMMTMVWRKMIERAHLIFTQQIFKLLPE